MESVLGRYRNLVILVGILFLQVLGLAVQVKRASDNQSSRLIRVWAVNSVTPLERSIVWIQNGAGNIWHNYFYLRGVRQENRDLREKIQQLEIEQARLREDAEQARRLQALLGFKEQYIAKTLAAQVIGSSGSEQSRSVFLDKGAQDGVKTDMAVITADGVIGKVLHVYRSTAQVLLINDQTSGVGAILEKSRLQGVMRGTPLGEVVMEKVMEGESIEAGEKVLTSGGDQIFPKGLPVGTVSKVGRGSDLFLSIRVKPSANLSKLEEVLVITQQEEREPVVTDAAHMRAADVLAQRLPSVPEKPAGQTSTVPPPTSGLKIAPPPAIETTGSRAGAKPAGTTANQTVPAAGNILKGQPQATPAKPAGGNSTEHGSSPEVNSPAQVKPAGKARAGEPGAAKQKPPAPGPAVVGPAPSPAELLPPPEQPH